MSTFDIEAAKRGEPVEHKSAAAWYPTHFVGLSKQGNPVIDKDGYGTITVPAADLRMAPKKVKVRWRVALIGSDLTLIANDEGHERVLESGEWGEFKQWLTDWQEAEVEQ